MDELLFSHTSSDSGSEVSIEEESDIEIET